MDNVIVMLGPTASGKTRLAVKLAKDINGEIVSADSMQVYKYMDIGTAKPDEGEMSGIKHYLADEIYPCEEFSVAKFRELALKYIREILQKGKIPIVVGGTGLYINSLIYNIKFYDSAIDWDLRNKLKKEAEEKGNMHLHRKLMEIDPEAAAKIHVNDTKRIIRAIEVYEYANKPISSLRAATRTEPPEYGYILIGLTMDRKKLYERIDQRVDEMFRKGLVEEVKMLKSRGYDKCAVAMQGLGYKEILSYLRGELTYEEAVNLIKMNTRRYAKRQMTWFRKIENVFWVDVGKYECDSEIIKYIEDYIAPHCIF